MSFGFGNSPGLSPVVEMGVPVDNRTTDVKGTLEFANVRGLLSVGYTGSWFDNQVPNIRFDNPLRAGDISGGPSAVQVPVWPSNSSVAVNLTGAYKLPLRTRATAAISVGRWNQNQELVPATINTAITLPELERSSAEAKADILSMLYNVTSRPVQNLWLNA